MRPHQRRSTRRYGLLFAMAVLSLSSTGLFAGQRSDNNTAGGLNVAVDLRHRVVVPQILYFRVGSDSFGAVDEVRFDVNPAGVGAGNNQTHSGPNTVPIGDGAVIAATSNGALPVMIMANVGSLTLSYDVSDPLGLGDGAGNFIPFDEILVASDDPGGLPTPVLANSGGGGANAVNISGNLFGGRVTQRRTTWTYSYANRTVPVAGKYEGTVRYTLAAP